jgi:hypothetical protein
MHSDCAKMIFENVQVKILFKGDYYGGQLPAGVLVICWKRVKIQMSWRNIVLYTFSNGNSILFCKLRTS